MNQYSLSMDFHWLPYTLHYFNEDAYDLKPPINYRTLSQVNNECLTIALYIILRLRPKSCLLLLIRIKPLLNFLGEKCVFPQPYEKHQQLRSPFAYTRTYLWSLSSSISSACGSISIQHIRYDLASMHAYVTQWNLQEVHGMLLH